MYINPLAMEHGVSSINFDPHKKNKSKIRSVGEKMVIDIGPSWIYQRELARSFRISSVNVSKSSENCGFVKFALEISLTGNSFLCTIVTKTL